MQVYDLKGKLVETLVEQVQRPGTYKVDFDANSYSSGIYIYTIRVGNKIRSRKMAIVK
ncbi:MAG: T9SS type A sorting domain-containing protein [Candidatus Marinimicrobia bacterium]|nr:T9SS type A sorting domain-containing protein [Candidatus Neomarinimicrobiota bacterium]